MAESPPAIAVTELSFAYPGGKPVLNRLTFDVAPGETVGLVGPNGAGKTTLFLCLAGVLPYRAGRIHLCGLDPANKAQRRELARHVGIVFQNSDDQLFATTVADDVAFGPLNLELPRDRLVDKEQLDGVPQPVVHQGLRRVVDGVGWCVHASSVLLWRGRLDQQLLQKERVGLGAIPRSLNPPLAGLLRVIQVVVHGCLAAAVVKAHGQGKPRARAARFGSRRRRLSPRRRGGIRAFFDCCDATHVLRFPKIHPRTLFNVRLTFNSHDGDPA